MKALLIAALLLLAGLWTHRGAASIEAIAS